MMLLAARLLGAAYWFAPPNWDQSHGTPEASSETSPVVFTENDFVRTMQDNPADPSGAEVIINLLPGLYPTEPLQFRFLYNQHDQETIQRLRSRRLTIRRAPGHAGAVVFQMKPGVPAAVTGAAGIFSSGTPIARWVIEDLTFDCNWENLASKTHPGYLKRFKNGALYLNGYTGAVRRVRIQHYGSNNYVPVAAYVPVGQEAFPLFIHATDFRQGPEPDSGAPTAWVIEDCEVSGFVGVHGGYCTAIMVTAGYPAEDPETGETRAGIGTIGSEIPAELRPQAGGYQYWFQVQDQPGAGPGQKDWRVATVRRCQVRNAVIGLGTAASGGVSFVDNVVLRAEAGFNTDTGPIRSVDLVNNAFLDVAWGGNIGGWGWWANGFVNYTVCSNLIRLSARSLRQNYTDFCVNSSSELVSDAGLPLGRCYTNASVGITVGGSSSIDLSHNRFTTRPQGQFFEPNRLEVSQAWFRPVYRPNYSSDHLWCSGPALPVHQESVPTMEELVASGMAFEFADYTALAPGSRTTNEIWAVALPPRGFPASGRLGWPGRVQIATNNLGRLTGVNEVCLGEPEPLDHGEFQVRARWLFQPGYLSPLATTQVNPPEAIRFEITHGQGQRIGFAGPTYSNGSALIRFTPEFPGHCQITAFVSGPGRSGPSLDREADFWTEIDHFQGQTVRFVRAPDVANDRTGAPGRVTLERTGAGPLRVKLRLEDELGLSLRSQPPTPYTAERFGRLAKLGSDFTLAAADGTELPQEGDGNFSVSFGPTNTQASILVVPVRDEVLESTVVYLSVDDTEGAYVAVPNGPGVSTHPFLPQSAAVAIYDGAQFRLVALSDWDPDPTREAAATFATAIDDQATPRIGGGATYRATGGVEPEITWLGYWRSDGVPPRLSRLPSPYAPDAQLLGLSANGLAAGTVGAGAFWADLLRRESGGLPGLNAAGAAAAWGVNPSSPNNPPELVAHASRIAGSARNETGVERPVLWSKAGADWAAQDLGAFRAGDLASAGVAYAVNDRGQVAGVSELTVEPAGTNAYRRAFRAAAGRGISDSPAPDGLLEVGPPRRVGESTLVPRVGSARAINRVGDAVGGAELVAKDPFVYRTLYHAVFWRQDRRDPKGLGALSGGDKSEALGVNAPLARSADGTFKRLAHGQYYPEYAELVGWSNAGFGRHPRRAFYALYTPYVRFWRVMLDLNDAHFVEGLEGWTLEEARAVNDQGYIAGVGSYLGARRAFLLAPLRSPPDAGNDPQARNRPVAMDPVAETTFDFVATLAGVDVNSDQRAELTELVRYAGVAFGRWDELGPAHFTNSFRLATRPQTEVLASVASGLAEVLPVEPGTVIGPTVPAGAAWASSLDGFSLLHASRFRECVSTSCVETVSGQQGPLAQSNNRLLAARFADVDGWHYGWIALDGLLEAYPILGSYSFSPQAAQPIVAGETDRPSLLAQASGTSLSLTWLSWDDAFVLESTEQLPGADWTPLSGGRRVGARKQVLVPLSDRARYFRLRK